MACAWTQRLRDLHLFYLLLVPSDLPVQLYNNNKGILFYETWMFAFFVQTKRVLQYNFIRNSKSLNNS